jgi:hypothetical protein
LPAAFEERRRVHGDDRTVCRLTVMEPRSR